MSRLAEKLRSFNLSGYESRTYLALVGAGPLKALELAVRAGVPRQKIYEVLDSLAGKGFAEMIPDRPRLFAAVEPRLALAEYLSRRRRDSEAQLAEQVRLAEELHEELEAVPDSVGHVADRLPVIRLIHDREHAAAQFREMLSTVHSECLQFGRCPYLEGADVFKGFLSVWRRGVRCRLLLDGPTTHGAVLPPDLPIEVRRGRHLPLKMTIFDVRCGLLALDTSALAFRPPRARHGPEESVRRLLAASGRYGRGRARRVARLKEKGLQ